MKLRFGVNEFKFWKIKTKKEKIKTKSCFGQNGIKGNRNPVLMIGFLF
jgi:hypothetical protein